jgi:hypothetical protein
VLGPARDRGGEDVVIRNGVFWCRHCAYGCPAKLPVNDLQRDLDKLGYIFFELVEDPRVGVADLDKLDGPYGGK